MSISVSSNKLPTCFWKETISYVRYIHPLISMKVFSRGSVVRVFDNLNLEFNKKEIKNCVFNITCYFSSLTLGS